jgi:glycosyltransferase involved in cell wall biosynthesis
MMMKKVGVVIPAWNEENDIEPVLKTVGVVDWLAQIVVVDDGSTDNTLEVAQACANDYPKMKVEHFPENKGKGAAMLGGIQALDSGIDIVMFLDADLIGLTPEHLKILFKPVEKKECEMTVAIFRHGYWRTDLSQRFAPNLNGQRCLPRKAAIRALEPLTDSGYGVEIGLTRYARRNKWRVKYVGWEGMTHDMKEDKLGLQEGAKIRWAIMYRQILVTWFSEWWQERREKLISLWESGT